MDSELMTRTRQAEIEREMVRLHTAAAAREAYPAGPRAASAPAAGRPAAISLRLLRALGLAS